MPSHWLQSAKEFVRPYYLKGIFFRLRSENCPSYFRDCWTFPSEPLDAVAAAPPGATRRDILFLPLADWHTRIQRTQHLALTLAESGYRCFYVNPHLGREFPSVYPFSPRRMLSSLGPRIRELHVHLPHEPVFHHRCLSAEESRLVTEAILRLPIQHEMGPPLILTSFPLWSGVAAELKRRWGSPVIYDCHDLMAGFGNIAEDLLRAEAALLDAADLTIFSAQPLLDHTRAFHPGIERRALLLRNAVRASDFTLRGGTGPVRPDAPVIGYAGSLSSWFDVEMVRRAAAARPDWRFRLIGRIEHPKIETLQRLPNVEFGGEVPYAELPRHVGRFDVATIPFLRNALTMSTNPIKLYEYFACGLPVVSSALPEVERYDGLVYLADSPEAFLRQLDQAVAERDAGLAHRRREVADHESWTTRCRELERRFEPL